MLCKVPTVQDAPQPMPSLISCTGVIGGWGLLSHARNTVTWLVLWYVGIHTIGNRRRVRGTRSTPMMAMEMPISLRENPSPPTVKSNDNTKLEIFRRHTPGWFTTVGTMRPPSLVPRPPPFLFFGLYSVEYTERKSMYHTERKLKNKK